MTKTEVPIKARCAAEFLGTYLLVLSVGCSVLGGKAVWAAAAIAATLSVLVYGLGAVSGAHLNPAVTIASAMNGRLMGGWRVSLYYVGVQLAGGICAGFTSAGLYGQAFRLGPGVNYVWAQAMVVEVLYTMLLCFVVLSITTKWSGNESSRASGIAIGLVIVAGGYPSAAVSGGCFNPAIAFGIDVSDAVHNSAWGRFGWSFAYLGFHVVGSIFGALLFRLVTLEAFHGDELEPSITPRSGSAPAAKTYEAPPVEDMGDRAPLRPRLICEFVGAFFLSFTVGMNVLTGSPAPALSIAAMLAVAVYAVGPISGAHINPAVTIAVLLCGGDERGLAGVREGIYYVAAQLLGGIFGGLVYCMTLSASFPLEPGSRYSWGVAAISELIFTFLLCIVMLSVTSRQTPAGDAYGLAVGACALIGGTAVGAISGAPLNPAIAFGVSAASMARGGAWSGCVAYTCFEVAGAALAAGVFRVLRNEDFTKSVPWLHAQPKLRKAHGLASA